MPLMEVVLLLSLPLLPLLPPLPLLPLPLSPREGPMRLSGVPVSEV
jgi:hypothetical protein